MGFWKTGEQEPPLNVGDADYLMSHIRGELVYAILQLQYVAWFGSSIVER
jgi:hypothetical protein